MFRYLYLFFFFLTLNAVIANADTTTKIPKQVLSALVVRNDTTKVAPRHFNTNALKNYSQQREFKYDDNFVGTSPWERFKQWFWNLFDVNPTLNSVTNYFLIALGVAALIFLILKLSGFNASIIKGKTAHVALLYDEFTENIHEMDLDNGIQIATQQHNYRLAVRLLYLKCLKQLSDAGQIAWDINKTNTVYVNELTNTDQRQAFNILTRQFEYVWYGEFNINEKIYSQINAMFTDFKVNRA
ncbi:hypothetical protein GCM10027049_06410 [Mucilaginibacter puniceus]